MRGGAGISSRLSSRFKRRRTPRRGIIDDRLGVMARLTVEIGDAFHKTDSPRVVWIVDSFNRNTEPLHAELTRFDDPMTRITVSVAALTDPRLFRRSDSEPR